MPNTKPAHDLDRPPDPAELLAAHQAGLTLVEYRAQKMGAVALEPDTDDEDRLEKLEQLQCFKVFRAFGAVVCNLSQSRASKRFPGLGDAFVIFPGLTSLWWESKRQRGARVSEAQREFHALCNGTASGSRHYIGGRREAEDLVIALGLAYRDEASGVLEPVRRP